MKKLVAFYKENKGYILNFFFFLVSLSLVVYFFPVERKFKYEFQKGKPWQHENLIAPFDFPIYKLPSELAKERDSIERQVKPYMVYDKNLWPAVETVFKEAYDKNWRSYFAKDSALRAQDKNYRRNHPKLSKDKFDKYFFKIKSLLKDLYAAGIYDPAELLDYKQGRAVSSIIVNRGNIVRTYDISQVYTLKQAYEILSEQLQQWQESSARDSIIIDFFRQMELNKFILANLKFDRDKTEELKQQALNNISPTMGFVQAGERIIYKGELVDNDKYRILLSLKKEYESGGAFKDSTAFITAGYVIVIIFLYITLILFIYNYKPDVLRNYRKGSMLLLLLTIFIVGASYVQRNDYVSLYIIPLAIVPVVVKVFFDERLALFVHLTMIFIIAFMAPNSFEFVILQFVSGYAAIFSLTTLSRRGQLYVSSAGVFWALSVLYLGIALTQEGNLSNIRWNYFGYFAINSFLILLAYPLIYAFERIFGFISDMTLIELSNTNNKLLRELAMKAPGTFQHSLQVANLAEAAANKVGANSLLVRTGALYHDIGKLYAPIFFTENQISGINPHDNLPFEESAKIIINHVAEGVNLAKKHKIPQQVIDFIRTHHGTSTVQYFYKNYIKQYPDRVEDVAKFTYPGPRPFSKETAILMMADSIEAASRSIKNIDKDKIDALVESIIDKQTEAKQFVNTDLTFREITVLKDFFKEMLINIYHMRIEYPK